MKFFIVDAFTETPFGGNPAGVILLDRDADFPPEAFMIKTAAELRYSETAFIKQSSATEFHIRYFTPASEVELCGHATIAAFAALLHSGIIEDNKDYINFTLAGKLTIKLRNGFVLMDMAMPEAIDTIQTPAALKELYSVMGIDFEPLTAAAKDGPVDLLPVIISTGLPDIIMPVKNKDTLNKITPDFSKLSILSEKYQVVGVHAFALESKTPGTTAFCRNFAPLYDIDEEAATGTANGALTYYLFTHGLINLNTTSVFAQGESMNRPSSIQSCIGGQGKDVKIQVGGSAVILAEGNLLIS